MSASCKPETVAKMYDSKVVHDSSNSQVLVFGDAIVHVGVVVF